MLRFFIFTLIFFISVESKDNGKIEIPDKTDTNIFNNLIDSILDVIDTELLYKPAVLIDTTNVKSETKEEVFVEKVVTTLMREDVPIVIERLTKNNETVDVKNSRTKDSEGLVTEKKLSVIDDTAFNKNYSLYALNVIYFETCDDASTSNFDKMNNKMKYFITVTNPNSDNCSDVLSKLHILAVDYVITLLIIDETKEFTSIFTFTPIIKADSCIKSVDKPTLTNIFDNNTLSRYAVRSKKSINLNKCPFKVGMATLYPFSQIKNKEKLKNNDPVQECVGSDMEIMKIVNDFFNGTIELYYISRKEENPYGETDFLKFLINGSMDVGTGGLYRIYGDVVEYSGIYSSQAVIWIYYAERPERSWQNLTKKVNGLYIFFIFYLCYTVIYNIIILFDGDVVSFANTLLYGWGALVGSSSLEDARSTKQKILNLCYLLMSLHLSAYISVHLYSFLTTRDPPHILSTMEDMITAHRALFLVNNSKYFVTDKRYVDFAKTSGECSSFVDCAEKTLKYKGLSVVLQGNFYPYQAASVLNGEARLLSGSELILTVYNEMLIRKDSPLIKKFARVVQSLFEAGIAKRLRDESIGILVLAKAAKGNSNMVANSYSCQAGCSITLNQFAGVFYVWIIGCLLSCIIFILEIFWNRNHVAVTPFVL